jgi:hypothetical protein
MRKLVLLMVLLVGGVVVCPAPALAYREPICDEDILVEGSDAWRAAGCAESDDAETIFDKIPGVVKAVFFVAGIVAVGMTILGGVRYSTSQGDVQKTKKAKDTIMYAVVGLVITLSAFAIVAFVVGAML